MPHKKKMVIAGTGCALADFLYNGIDFKSSNFTQYLSSKSGDGGLSPGKLVFTEELEKYANKSYLEILNEIANDRLPDAFNVGGPSLVSLIHASQLLNSDDYQVKFYGIAGTDKIANKIFKIVNRTPLNIDSYLQIDQFATPFTDVFSDPDYNDGQGERSFVNNLGASLAYSPEYLDQQFFNADIVCFGGTALVPQIHDHLTSLLQKAKSHHCITIVNTVYDFRNEKLHPGQPWPLVNKGCFGLIDVLIMNNEEALKISGHESINQAIDFFVKAGARSFLITNGTSDVIVGSDGWLFKKTNQPIRMPVSDIVKSELMGIPANLRDTTGCGDNFAGGVAASLAWQLKRGTPGQLDITEAASWGIVSGGFACSIIGGTWIEKYPREKFQLITYYYEQYQKQVKYEK